MWLDIVGMKLLKCGQTVCYNKSGVQESQAKCILKREVNDNFSKYSFNICCCASVNSLVPIMEDLCGGKEAKNQPPKGK